MGGEPKDDGRSTEDRPNTSGRPMGAQPNTNRRSTGHQWESIEGQWAVNRRKIEKNVKIKEKRQAPKQEPAVFLCPTQ